MMRARGRERARLGLPAALGRVPPVSADAHLVYHALPLQREPGRVLQIICTVRL